MSHMAPERNTALAPGFDSGATDFELAAQLYHAIFFHDGNIAGETVRRLCCSALESPDGCFSLASHTDTAAWLDLRTQSEVAGTLAAGMPAAGDAHPSRLGFPLTFRNERLGFVGVAGRAGGYDADAM